MAQQNDGYSPATIALLHGLEPRRRSDGLIGRTGTEEREYRAILAIAIKDYVVRAGRTPNQAARAFGVDQDGMLELLSGKFAGFDLASLLDMMEEGDLDPPPWNYGEAKFE